MWKDMTHPLSIEFDHVNDNATDFTSHNTTTNMKQTKINCVLISIQQYPKNQTNPRN